MFHQLSILQWWKQTFIASVAATIFIITFWIVSAPFPVEAREKKTVTLAMSLTPLSAPVIIAESEEYFAKNDLDVIIKDFIGGHRTIKAVFQGKADIATSSEVVVIFNSFNRSDFTIFCTFVTSDNDVKIITRKNTGIRKVQDLAGHRVGTITGASAQFFLDQTLLMAGVESSQVEVVHINPEEGPSFLETSKVDAIVVWEPLAYLTIKKVGLESVVVSHDKLYTKTFNAVTLQKFAKENPDVLERIVRALIKAVEFIHSHPKEAQHIVAKRINSDFEQVRAVWKDFNFEVSLHQWLLTTLEKKARWAIERKLVSEDKIPSYLHFMDLRFMDRVRPNAVTVFR